jgi:phytoene dehydrogenase-like protein
VYEQLRRWRYGVGTFKVDFALSGPVPWASDEARRAAVVHVGGTVGEQVEAAHAAGRGEVPRRPSILVGQHSVHDGTRAPPGQQALYAYTHVPARYPDDDSAVADLIEERIEALAPGFRALVLGRTLRSPAQLERDNPSLVGGDLGGGSVAPDQLLLFRPAPRLARYRTPLRGLYVASASTHPGPGVHGVPGAGAARAVRRDGAWPIRRLSSAP